MPSTSSEPSQLSRRAAAVNELLGRIGLSKGGYNEWWNRTAYPELGGRTPTQTWLAGDHSSVERLVLSWYGRSEEAAQKTCSDPGFLRMVNERRQAIASENERRRTA